MNGEGSSVDTEASNKWRKNVTPIIKQYAPKNIFNMDETAVLQCASEENASYQR
jgi:hypothetical protein